MSLRVATVFSGIGAIEHALDRMGIEHEIVLACDNSNIDWTEKCTKKKSMIDLLNYLDQIGIKYPGIDRLGSCWKKNCDSNSDLAFIHFSPAGIGAGRGVGKLSNLMICCGGCNIQLADSTSTDETLPNLEEVLRQCISSIMEPAQKKRAVDLLYASRGRAPFVEQTYISNYQVPTDHFHKDVTFLDGSQYRDGVDLFVGGSPCQSFSFVGHQGGFDDARGTLFYDFVRLVDEIRPKMFIWENVKGVYTHDKGKTWEVISKCFDNTGYTWHHEVLNSKDYGIPQHRRRVFVVGFLKEGSSFSFPKPVELKSTMQDFLEDNVAGKYYLGTKGVDFVTWDKNHRKQYTQIDGEVMLCQKANQQFNWHGDFVFVEENNGQYPIDEKHFLSQKVEAYVMATGTKGFRSIPKIDLEVARPLLSSMHKNHRAGVDNYVTTEGRIRMLTPTECLRLMGFCDSFKQVVSNNQLYRQAGNSIVVDVLIAIMAQAIPILAKQDNTFSNLKERAERIRELFDELPERQIQQSDLERVVAALSD